MCVMGKGSISLYTLLGVAGGGAHGQEFIFAQLAVILEQIFFGNREVAASQRLVIYHLAVVAIECLLLLLSQECLY